jgi:hypothetical protein
MQKKPVCKYFLENRCNRGDKCPFLHEFPPGMQPNPQQPQHPQQHNSHICKFFLSNSCSKPNCGFFHGYGNQLKHLKTINGDIEINNLIKMDDSKYIASNEREFIVRFTNRNEEVKESLNKEGFKIGKMIFSGNKVIFGLMKES